MADCITQIRLTSKMALSRFFCRSFSRLYLSLGPSYSTTCKFLAALLSALWRKARNLPAWELLDFAAEVARRSAVDSRLARSCWEAL